MTIATFWTREIRRASFAYPADGTHDTNRSQLAFTLDEFERWLAGARGKPAHWSGVARMPQTKLRARLTRLNEVESSGKR